MSAHGVVEINIAAAASIFDMGGTVNGVAVWPAPLGSSGSARPRRPWSSSWLATTALGARGTIFPDAMAAAVCGAVHEFKKYGATAI